jgi:hypothetical protein
MNIQPKTRMQHIRKYFFIVLYERMHPSYSGHVIGDASRIVLIPMSMPYM